jgi:hypothetical protein
VGPASSFHLLGTDPAVDLQLGEFDECPARLVVHVREDVAATRDAEEPGLPLADPVADEREHRRRVAARQPFGFGHGGVLRRRQMQYSITSAVVGVTAGCGV